MKKIDKIKVFFFTAIILLSGKTFYGQQDVQYTHNMFNQFSVNPGYAGSGNDIVITTIQRQQWLGLEGNPNNLMFTIHSPFNLFGKKHGVGIQILNDNIGFSGIFTAQLAYSYKVNLSSGELGIGINTGILNYQLSNANWKPAESGDASIPTGDQRDLAFDLGAGAYYSTDAFYAGFSATHLNMAQLKFSETNGPSLRPHFYFTGGYNLRLPNPLFEFQPSVFIMSDVSSMQFNANVNFIYNKKIWAGVSYRLQDAMSAIVGMELFNGIKLGYAFDLNTSKLSSHNSNSHEVFLSYSFSFFGEKVPTKFKSIRLL